MSIRANAILALIPDANFTLYGNKISIWDSEEEQPTEEQIQAKMVDLQADYDSKKYQRDRALQYPSITDVVVALVEKQEGDDTMWKEITAQRAKVKKDFPKP